MIADCSKAGNSYTFHCPTVGRDTRAIVCAFKRNKHWRGENFADQDCRAAMNGGCCPIVMMLKHEWKEGEEVFVETESKKVHSVPAFVKENLNRLQMVPSQARGLNLTPEQFARFYGENARPYVAADDTHINAFEDTKIRKVRKKKTDMLDIIDESTSDMSSMLNTAMQNSSAIEP